MTGRRKKKKYKAKYIMLITSIAALNLVGISYAHWNDGLNIATTVSTGNIEPAFCTNNYYVDQISGSGDLSISYLDDYTMYIDGTVEPGFKAMLNYCVINKGTVPVKFTRQHQYENGNGIKLRLDQQTGILLPEEYFNNNQNGNPKLQIQTSQEGNYEFEIELPFTQWNNK